MEKATNDIIKEVCELDARLNILDARIPDIKAEEIGIFYGELCYLAEKANKQIEYLNGNGQSEDGSAIYICFKAMFSNFKRCEAKVNEFLAHSVKLKDLLKP